MGDSVSRSSGVYCYKYIYVFVNIYEYMLLLDSIVSLLSQSVADADSKRQAREYLLNAILVFNPYDDII